MFGIAVFFQTGDEVIHDLREGVSVNVSGFFNAGIDLEKLFLLFEAAQIETVVEDGTVFADDVGIGGVGHESGKRAREYPFGTVGKSDLSRFHGG